MVKGKLRAVSPQRRERSGFRRRRVDKSVETLEPGVVDIEESVDTDAVKEQRTKVKKVKGKKLVIVTVILILIIFISAQLLYLYVIPRVTMEFKTVYHEATGGGGTGGLINVNSKFVNSGTVDVDDFSMTVTVLNATREILVNKTYDQSLVYPGDSYELKLTTNGNTFEKFYIILQVNFETGKNEYTKKYLYETHEDSMNIGYEDSIFDWGF